MSKRPIRVSPHVKSPLIARVDVSPSKGVRKENRCPASIPGFTVVTSVCVSVYSQYGYASEERRHFLAGHSDFYGLKLDLNGLYFDQHRLISLVLFIICVCSATEFTGLHSGCV